MLLRAIADETYNHVVAAGDAGADLWIGFVAPGEWTTWSGNWPLLNAPWQNHVHEAFCYIVDTNGVHKNGVQLYICQLIRKGKGFVYLTNEYQGNTVPGVTARDIQSEWGVAFLSRNAGHVATDVIACSLRYSRRLP